MYFQNYFRHENVHIVKLTCEHSQFEVFQSVLMSKICSLIKRLIFGVFPFKLKVIHAPGSTIQYVGQLFILLICLEVQQRRNVICLCLCQLSFFLCSLLVQLTNPKDIVFDGLSRINWTPGIGQSSLRIYYNPADACNTTHINTTGRATLSCGNI